MKILHVITGLCKTAGTTVFVIELARIQVALGNEVKIAVHNIADSVPPPGVEFLESHCLESIPFVPDIVHIHAVWSIRQVRAMRWCQCRRYKYVVSIHGCFMPRVFAKNPVKKWTFYLLFLKRNINKASAIHCTSEHEMEVCKKLGFQRPFIVAPLGVDMPRTDNLTVDKPFRNISFLGRLGEEKGLIILLDAWKSICHEGWRLLLAGPDWLGYKQTLDEKITNECIEGVELVGPVYGERKDDLYRSADVFVLPSPMENFSMVVLEALSYGVPVIATKGTPWKDLSECNCGWWINQGVESLRFALQESMTADDVTRHEMGARGRKLAKDKYSWTVVWKTILDGYEKVI